MIPDVITRDSKGRFIKGTISLAKGKKQTPEARAKMSKSHKIRFELYGSPLKGRKGSESGSWHGGIKTTNGRVFIYKSEHPYADINGYVRRARLVVEARLKRFLNDDETVHHLDGDKMNDKSKNLIVLSKSDHTRLHNYLMWGDCDD